MRRSQKWQLALLLVLVGSCATEAITADRPDHGLAFTVYIHDYAQVDPTTLASAGKVASAIFRNAGVETHWIAVPEASDGSPTNLAEGESNTLTNLRVYILPQEMAQKLAMPSGVMGLAPGRGPDRLLVYVFYQWLRDLAYRQVGEQSKGNILWHATMAQILGAMMAHELGHILLDLPMHSPSGIMKGDWDPKDLSDVAYGLLLFTRRQSETIQVDVARRNSQLSAAAESAN